ncbi:MAG TPA: hypothetical protein VFA59_01165 [Vicinamibacterales bacterium]|nr:hypothetical protein [Vicinamibacterales bacterium]
MARINPVDAAVAVTIALMAVAGTIALDKVAPVTPVLTSVTPSVFSGRDPIRLWLHGRAIRPFLEARVASHGNAPDNDPRRAAWIGVGDLTVGELRFPPLPPGDYDLHIYDNHREIATWPSAFMVNAQ